jgi:hypothetical protein
VTDAPVDEEPGQTPPEEVEGATTDSEKEKTLIAKAVEAAKEVAHDVATAIVGSPPAGAPGEGGGDPGPATTSRSIEQAAEDAVRAALDKLGLEGKTVNVDKVEVTTPDTKEPETPPMTLSRVTRALWGDKK